MSNLKQRIEGLKSATNSAETISVCNESLKQIKEYSQFNLSTDATQQFEAKVAETTILALEAIDESATKNFIHIENRIQGMDNLGVKRGLKAIAESAIASHPAAMYRFKKLAGAETQPEWLVIENVIDALKGFDWDPTVKAAVSEMETNFGKYKEDIKIYKAVYEAKNSRSEFLMAGLQKDIDKYLNERTASNRATLIEKLNSFNYDPNIRALYNTVLESEKSFQLKAGSNDAIVTTIYSPVIIAEGVEIFSVFGKAYAKSGTNIAPLTEEEAKGLPEHFNFISTFLAQPNVKVTENHITIFSKDKKVEIVEEAEELKIYINGKNVSMNEFHSVYLNSGMFRFEEKDTLTAVNKIVENWDSIFELDFAKSIFPKSIPTRRADIFKLDEKTYINTVDVVMKENKFYPNCNATQSRTMILEFAHYDLGLTFTDVLVKEEAVLNKLEESKKEFLDAISYLETRRNLLENHENAEIRESEEVKEILSAIDEEISTLKTEYYNVQTEINSLKTANEGVTVGDEVEVGEEKKKQ